MSELASSPFTTAVPALALSTSVGAEAEREPGLRPVDALAAAHRALRCGRPVLLLDDVGPYGTGSLVLAAQRVGTAAMAFLVRESSGIVCVALTGARLDALRIPPLAGPGRIGGPEFAVSVDLRSGPTTGISARDRALTVRALADPATRPADLLRPGHVLPTRVHDAGVLGRPRPEEAAIDLCRTAGLAPAAALATAVDEAGELAGADDLAALAARAELVLVRLSAVLAARRRATPPVRAGACAALPTRHGRFRAVGFESAGAGCAREDAERGVGFVPWGPDRSAGGGPGFAGNRSVRDIGLAGDVAGLGGGRGPTGSGGFGAAADPGSGPTTGVAGVEHLALVSGEPSGSAPVLARVHVECVAGDVLGASDCDCAAQLGAALAAIDAAGCGVLVYLRNPSGIVLGCAHAPEADPGIAAAMLREVGAAAVLLLTDDPAEPARLRAHGIAVAGRRPLLVAPEAEVVRV